MLCSHLLCEVPVDTFDPKMNLENLTKCLQSLKEFYRDLRLDKVRKYYNKSVFSLVLKKMQKYLSIAFNVKLLLYSSYEAELLIEFFIS